MAEVGEFNLIVTGVDGGRLADVAKEFASAFGLDATIAQQICKSAPIVFAQKLTKSEVKAITPKLVHLSTSGIEFRITGRIAGKVPKVNWPVRPQFTAGGSGGPNGLAFEWENNAFVCPGCGEAYLFKRLGKLDLVEPPAEAGADALMPAPTPAPRPAIAPRAASARPAPTPFAAQLELLDEGSSKVEKLEAPPPLMPELDPPQVAEAMEEMLSEAASIPEPMVEEAPAPVVEEVAPLAEDPEPMLAEEAAPEPVVEQAAAEAEEGEVPAGGGDLYNVFLSKITDNSKRDKVAELISKVKKCQMNEAKELTSRLVIPLAKGVSKVQAEEILSAFKKLKIFGRMTKVK